jgi:ethanolamine utilization protein EutN
LRKGQGFADPLKTKSNMGVNSMIIAKVTGAVVSTIKDSRLSGYKLAILQEYSLEKKKVHGRPFVAVDIYGAGLGSLVCVTRGSSAQSSLGVNENENPVERKGSALSLPIDAAVVAIIDDFDINC